MIGGEGAWSGDDQPSPYCCQELAPVTRCHLSPLVTCCHLSTFMRTCFQWWQQLCNRLVGLLTRDFLKVKLNSQALATNSSRATHYDNADTVSRASLLSSRTSTRLGKKLLLFFFISIKNCSCVIKRWEREKKENGRKTWILKVKWAKRAPAFFPTIAHDSHFEDETLTIF